MEQSKLIEPNVRNYLTSTLQSCRETRSNVYYLALNIGVFILFIGVFGSGLYYCYTQKKSPEEMQYKMVKDQEFILNKIRFYQSSKQFETTSSISNLPSINKSSV